MNDNDIIKALEACKSGYCLIKKCPLFDLYDGDHDSITKCTSKLAEISLDLINRLKAEIKVLQNDVSFLDKYNDELLEDNDELNAENDHLRAVLDCIREDDEVD